MPFAMVMFVRNTFANFAARLFVVEVESVFEVTISVLKDQKQEYTQTNEE
jgi:hypothetical protein